MPGTSLYEAATPRPEVLEGTLTEAIFAASLDEVAAGTAPDAYGDPETFFGSTHPSAGLKQLLNEVLGRVGGGKPDAAPVIRLEENLGGGKTHNLIALYHAVSGGFAHEQASEFMDPALLPRQPVEQVAVFVGTGTGATSFAERQGIRPKTLWGHLALQLGGPDAYAHVSSDDRALTAPGAQALRRVLDGKPSMILIDELARYLQVADGVTVGESTLAKQTTAFLMAIMEAVSAEASSALVMTITQTAAAYGSSTQSMLDALTEARSLMARKEHIIRPSEEADLPQILARRLFSRIDRSATKEVAQRYVKVAEEAVRKGIDLPESAMSGAWIAEIEHAYPFHPALIRVLDKRLSTIPNFQRTRGALRLLARAIRNLWSTRAEGVELLHLHHLDLSAPEIVEELTSRLDRERFEPVVRADIASQPGGEPSNAEKVDAKMGQAYARRLAIAAYLYSLTADVAGTPAGELVVAVLEPGDDPAILSKALDTLEHYCWYLHTDARGLRFSTEASLVKLIQDEAQRIPMGKVKERAQAILEELFRDSALKVRRTWRGDDVGDHDDQAYLVVLHWDELCVSDPTGAVPDRVRALWERTPAGGNRTYRNRLVILAPVESRHEAMIATVRAHLARESLWDNTEVRSQLSQENQQKLRQLHGSSRLEARVAVCNHLSALYVPQAQGLVGHQLDIVTQATQKQNQTDAIVDWLAAREKTLAAGDKPLDPAFIKSKLGQFFESPQTTMELVRAFARRTDLKMVLDRDRILGLVVDGTRKGAWEYHDPTRGADGWATKSRPEVPVRLAEDTLLHPLGSAPPPAPVACPMCGKVHGAEGCEALAAAPIPEDAYSSQGAAAVALAEVRQAAIDSGQKRLKELTISIEHNGSGGGPELARLLAMVPEGIQGVGLEYDIDVQSEMANPQHQLLVRYRGVAADYQSLKATVQQVLQGRPAVLRSSVRAVFDPAAELSGQQIQDVSERARSTGPAACQVRFVTEDGA
ncbi:MAG: DUF499 domain-containing protein [Actinomycetota bacterium]